METDEPTKRKRGRPPKIKPLGTVEQVVVEAAPHGNDAPVLSVREQILAGLIEPPRDYRKAADYQLGKGPWQIIRCRECGLDTYTRDPLKQDVCEEDLWQLMQQIAEVEKTRVLRATDRMINPFRSIDPFRELGGSLPSVKQRG